MTIKELLKKYKRKYPGVPYEISNLVTIISKKNGKIHSYNDAPAYIQIAGYDADGNIAFTKFWYKKGLFHREDDKPALIFQDGRKEYRYEGKEYDPKLNTHKAQKKHIDKLTPKKTEKQKQREDLLKEFVSDLLIHP